LCVREDSVTKSYVSTWIKLSEREANYSPPSRAEHLFAHVAFLLYFFPFQVSIQTLKHFQLLTTIFRASAVRWKVRAAQLGSSQYGSWREWRRDITLRHQCVPHGHAVCQIVVRVLRMIQRVKKNFYIVIWAIFRGLW